MIVCVRKQTPVVLFWMRKSPTGQEGRGLCFPEGPSCHFLPVEVTNPETLTLVDMYRLVHKLGPPGLTFVSGWGLHFWWWGATLLIWDVTN